MVGCVDFWGRQGTTDTFFPLTFPSQQLTIHPNTPPPLPTLPPNLLHPHLPLLFPPRPTPPCPNYYRAHSKVSGMSAHSPGAAAFWGGFVFGSLGPALRSTQYVQGPPDAQTIYLAERDVAACKSKVEALAAKVVTLYHAVEDTPAHLTPPLITPLGQAIDALCLASADVREAQLMLDLAHRGKHFPEWMLAEAVAEARAEPPSLFSAPRAAPASTFVRAFPPTSSRARNTVDSDGVRRCTYSLSFVYPPT